MERYVGFYIEEPLGNNIFSYDERTNKKIFVPKLIKGTLDDVSLGENIVFNEIFLFEIFIFHMELLFLIIPRKMVKEYQII